MYRSGVIHVCARRVSKEPISVLKEGVDGLRITNDVGKGAVAGWCSQFEEYFVERVGLQGQDKLWMASTGTYNLKLG